MHNDQESIQASTRSGGTSIDGEIDRLNRSVIELRQHLAAGRRRVILFAVLVVLMFGVFITATYTRIRDNFNADAVQKSVTERGTQVLPLATSMLIQTGRNSMPAYRTAVMQAMEKRGPVLAKNALAELKHIPETNGKAMHAKLQLTFDRVVKRIEPDFKAAFPSLSDERRQQLIADFATKQITAQNDLVAKRILQIYTNDAVKMESVMEKFTLPPASSATAQSNAELERRFLHTMVSLLDEQIDAAYEVPVAAGVVAPAAK